MASALLRTVALVATITLTTACGTAPVSDAPTTDDEPAAVQATTDDEADVSDGTEEEAVDPDAAPEGAESDTDEADADHMDDDGHMDEPMETSSSSYDRLVEVEMVDIAFVPTELTVRAGETVRFHFVNTGAAVHEALIADEHMQDEHEEDMRSGAGHDSGDGHHGDDTMAVITLEPGEEGELDFTFSSPGEMIIGCHVPGHYAAGMLIEVTVTE